jgi:hypothetical protein
MPPVPHVSVPVPPPEQEHARVSPALHDVPDPELELHPTATARGSSVAHAAHKNTEQSFIVRGPVQWVCEARG